jgi:hypothetical protein
MVVVSALCLEVFGRELLKNTKEQRGKVNEPCMGGGLNGKQIGQKTRSFLNG